LLVDRDAETRGRGDAGSAEELAAERASGGAGEGASPAGEADAETRGRGESGACG